MMKHVKLYGTTAADQSLTVTAGMPSYGQLHAVEWIDGDLTDGIDAVLSVVRDDGAADYTLLTLTNANVDLVYYPRELIDTVAGVEIAGNYAEPVINGYLKLAITDGGASKSGGCIVYYEGN